MPQLNAGGTFLVSAYDRANVKLLATGRVTALDSQIDTTTGTVKVRAQFDNADNALFPNQFVNAQLLVKTLHDVVTVPTAAIQRGAPGAYVYVVNADNTVSVRPIKLGPTDGRWRRSLRACRPGERVVVDGTDRLRDGARVTIPAAGQAAAPATDHAEHATGESAPTPGAAAPDAQSRPIIRKMRRNSGSQYSRGAARANSVKILRDDEAMR